MPAPPPEPPAKRPASTEQVSISLIDLLEELKNHVGTEKQDGLQQLKQRAAEHPEEQVKLKRDILNLAGAEALLSEAVRVMKETIGEDHTDGLICKSNLGALYKEKGELQQADALLRDTLAKMRVALGERHPATLAALVQLGLVQLELHDLVQAEQLLAEALTANRETFGDSHPQTLASITWLAGLHEAKGELQAALPLHREVLAGFAAASHPMTQRCAGHVVALLRQQGHTEEAEMLAAKHGVPAVAPAPEASTAAATAAMAAELPVVETSAKLLAPVAVS